VYDTEHIAVPDVDTGWLAQAAIGEPLSAKATDPAGVPDPGGAATTVAVKTTDWPVTAVPGPDTVVTVGAAPTVILAGVVDVDAV
jgi:hypothetical protein